MKKKKTPAGQQKRPAKRVIQVRIPALERFIKDARPWGLVERHPQAGWGGKAYDQQRTDPDTKDLLKKVGMKGGDRVLFVAGHRATWTLALAKAGAKIVYSDVSKELTDFVRKNVEHKNIVDYLCTSYFLYPTIPNQYDWTFTFEAVGQKFFIFFLSLLNRCGGKYVLWDSGEHSERKLDELAKALKLCEKLYKVKGTTSIRKIVCKDRTGTTESRRHHIFTVRTSDEAREKMYLDLRLFHFFFKRKKSSSAQICTVMNCSWEELKRSLHRLSIWSDLFTAKFARTIPLKCGQNHRGSPSPKKATARSLTVGA